MFENKKRDANGRLEGDENLIVNFSYEAEPDQETTDLTGIQSFKDVETIEIRIPGDRETVIHTHLNKFYKERFFREYEIFKAGDRGEVIGFPIKQWAQVSTAQVRTLAGLSIFTVEALAMLPDSQAMKYSISGLKSKAQLFLENQKDDAVLMKQQRELEKRDAELKLLTEKIELLMAATQKSEAVVNTEEVKKSPGRPKAS